MTVFGVLKGHLQFFCSAGEKVDNAFFLALAVLEFLTLRLIEVLDVVQDGTGVNMGHVVVLGQLLGIEGLACERLSNDGDLEWLQIAFFAELVLDLLDVGGEARLAEPFEVASILWRVITILSCLTRLRSDKQSGRLRLDVQKQELAPVEVQLKGRACGMARLEVGRDVDRLDEAGTDAGGNGLDETTLAGLLGIVDTEDVLAFGFGLEDFLHHAGQVSYVDGRDVVLALSNDGESFRVLEPCFFEVAVKNGLTLSVEHTCRNNVSFDSGTLRSQDKVLDLLDDAKLVRGLPSLVVLLGERVVQMASADLLFLQERLISILGGFVGDLR